MSCKVYTVYPTGNRAPAYMDEYALCHCTGLVGVSTPFGALFEILDLDMGMGPHLEAFEIAPIFGLGEVLQPTPPPLSYPVLHTIGPVQAPQSSAHVVMSHMEPMIYQPYEQDPALTVVNQDRQMNIVQTWLNLEPLIPENTLFLPRGGAITLNKGIIIKEPGQEGLKI
ncbi:hypothetical protein AgCh_029027 [Apium graveolens]